ncbi:glutamate--tRNA ligase [candidate division KSB1 bacterium]|nr:glutamate--tRNA ligase [candidate division KSB1 bacterium]
MDENMVRVRFAPSPTGFVHIGSLRTALYNYLYAKRHNGQFILRIEDTDRNRFVKGATENLVRVLEWSGLIPDEGPMKDGGFGPYYQSQRTELYLKHAQELINTGKAYLAFDTPEEIEMMRSGQKKAGNYSPMYNFVIRRQMRNSLTMSEQDVQDELEKQTPYVVRLLVPENQDIEFDDIIRGRVVFNTKEVDDQILIKSDGFPTYHLANVVDDHFMQITHVIRGEEWLSSVPKHLLLYRFFGWQVPHMAHLPLIFNPDGSKMSKRQITDAVLRKESDDLRKEILSSEKKIDPNLELYIQAGYEREAILNYIALLGWNPGEGDERQIFSTSELEQEFTLERVNKSGATFDIKKLNWINREHLVRISLAETRERLKTLLEDHQIDPFPDHYLLQVIELLQPRVNFIDEYWSKGLYFFQDPVEYDRDGIKKRWKDRSAHLILEFFDKISKLESFTAENIETRLRQITEQHELGAGQLIHPVRLAVSGTTAGPGLFEMLQVLGKETVMRRLKRAAEIIPSLKS